MGNGISVNVGERIKLKNEVENFRADRMSKIRLQVDQYCSREEGKDFKNLEEAEKYLQCLLRERDILEKDFYGVNLTAYRYVNIFYRLGYIRYRLKQIEEEIKETKIEICRLRDR